MCFGFGFGFGLVFWGFHGDVRNAKALHFSTRSNMTFSSDPYLFSVKQLITLGITFRHSQPLMDRLSVSEIDQRRLVLFYYRSLVAVEMPFPFIHHLVRQLLHQLQSQPCAFPTSASASTSVSLIGKRQRILQDNDYRHWIDWPKTFQNMNIIRTQLWPPQANTKIPRASRLREPLPGPNSTCPV